MNRFPVVLYYTVDCMHVHMHVNSCLFLLLVVCFFLQFRRFQTELEDEFGDEVKVVSVHILYMCSIN